MVEVYRTNVENRKQADYLLIQLGRIFPGYEVNFDLDDCDSILRIDPGLEHIEDSQIIVLMADLGFSAQVLSDIPRSPKGSMRLDFS